MAYFREQNSKEKASRLKTWGEF